MKSNIFTNRFNKRKDRLAGIKNLSLEVLRVQTEEHCSASAGGKSHKTEPVEFLNPGCLTG